VDPAEHGERVEPMDRGLAMRVVAAVVVLAALLAYAATLRYEFVWDDTLLIDRSVELHHWRALPRLLGSHFWAEVGESSPYYRPLATLTFFVDTQLWGRRPLGFHLTNVLLHAGVSLAVAALARRLAGGAVAAALAGLLFALHPIHTESVAFISGRTDVLAALGVVLAVLGFARWRAEGGTLALLGSLGACLLGLLAKEVAVVVPVLVAAFDWATGRAPATRREALRAVARYALYAVPIGLYAVCRWFALGRMIDAEAAAWAPLWVRTLSTLDLIGMYVRVVLVPFPDNPYPLIVPTGWPPAPTWWASATILVAAVGLTASALRRDRGAGLGALWFWIALAPSTAVNLLPLPTVIMGERFLYLPSVGVSLIAGQLLARAIGPIARLGSAQLPAVPAVTVAALVVAGLLGTMARNEHWKDNDSLFTRMIETTPHAPLPHVNLAFTQLPRGEIHAANQHLRRAAELNPREARALVGVGLTEAVLGRRERSLAPTRRALELAPDNPHVLATAGAVFLYREEAVEAERWLRRSLALHPNQVHPALNLAVALNMQGRTAEAQAQVERARGLAELLAPELPFLDRVTAEVYTRSDPARAIAAWERYIVKLRAIQQGADLQHADIAHAERQLALLRARS
jgi:tetratricopeptide (TPR) repeat protein